MLCQTEKMLEAEVKLAHLAHNFELEAKEYPESKKFISIKLQNRINDNMEFITG